MLLRRVLSLACLKSILGSLLCLGWNSSPLCPGADRSFVSILPAQCLLRALPFQAEWTGCSSPVVPCSPTHLSLHVLSFCLECPLPSLHFLCQSDLHSTPNLSVTSSSVFPCPRIVPPPPSQTGCTFLIFPHLARTVPLPVLAPLGCNCLLPHYLGRSLTSISPECLAHCS